MRYLTFAILGDENKLCNNEFIKKFQLFLNCLLEDYNVKKIILNDSEFSLLTSNILLDLKEKYNFKIRIVTANKKFKDEDFLRIFSNLYDEIDFKRFSKNKIIKYCIKNCDCCIYNFKDKIKTIERYCNKFTKLCLKLETLFK